jgi:hypothetical protein
MLSRRIVAASFMGFALLTLALWVAVFPSMDDRGTRLIRLAGQDFRIPVRNLAEDIPLWLRFVPGLRDGSNQVMIQFSAAELRQIQPFDQSRDRPTLGTLTVLGAETFSQVVENLSRTAQQAWQGQGEYEGRTLEPVVGTRLVRVHMVIDRGTRWTVLHATAVGGIPESSDLPSSLLGYCHETRGGMETSCLVSMMFDDVMLHVWVSEKSLEAIDDIRAFFRQRVREWRQSKDM